MPQNKLKEKVNALTRVVGQILKDLQQLDSLSRGTLTAFQLHLGEKKWNELVEELKDKEKRLVEESKEKKLDLDVE